MSKEQIDSLLNISEIDPSFLDNNSMGNLLQSLATKGNNVNSFRYNYSLEDFLYLTFDLNLGTFDITK